MTPAPLYAVFGNPVAHSKSPQIHQMFAAQEGVSIRYERRLSQPETFAREIAAFFAEGGAGANVTLPFKTRAAELAHECAERAAAAGAANTLIPFSDGLIRADNTDGLGLVCDITRNLGIPPLRQTHPPPRCGRRGARRVAAPAGRKPRRTRHRQPHPRKSPSPRPPLRHRRRRNRPSEKRFRHHRQRHLRQPRRHRPRHSANRLPKLRSRLRHGLRRHRPPPSKPPPQKTARRKPPTASACSSARPPNPTASGAATPPPPPPSSPH